MWKRVLPLIILMFAATSHALGHNVKAQRKPSQASNNVPPPPPPPPPPGPPPDFIDDDSDFDDGDDLPDETDYANPNAPAPGIPQPPQPQMPPPAQPSPAPTTTVSHYEPPAHELNSKLHFHVVQGEFWEKGKPRERGNNIDQN